MSKPNRAKRQIPIEILVAILTVVGGLLAALVPLIGPPIIDAIKTSIAPTPACMNATDLLVTFQVIKDDKVIAKAAAGETIFLERDTRVYFKMNIESLTISKLPEINCNWTNTGIATDGQLLHHSGCSLIDYQSGKAHIQDAISVQINQPSCPALPSYPFFIMPKP